jgi:hypothetical protein
MSGCAPRACHKQSLAERPQFGISVRGSRLRTPRVDVRGWLWAVAAKSAPAPRSAGQMAGEIHIQPCGSLVPGGMQEISPCLVIATAMPSGQEPSCLSAPLISRASPTVNEATRNQTWAPMIVAATAATVSSRGAIRSRATVCDTLLTLGGAPAVAYTSTGSPWVVPFDQSESALRG